MNRSFIIKQLRLHSSLEKTLEQFKRIGEADLTAARIRSRIVALKELWTTYQEGYDQLVLATPEATQITTPYFKEQKFDHGEEIFHKALDFMTENLEKLEPVSVSLNQSGDKSTLRADASALSLSHLPPIRLPPFDGDYAEWESFRDRFTALIINNRDLTDFARMHFLASAIKGRARDCIGNLAITADNFQIAWQTLTARYENKRRLLNSNLSALLGLPAVSKEHASEIQLLRDRVNVAIASLRKLNRTSGDLWNDIVVYIMTQKLDPTTKKAWNLKTSDSDRPPTQEELDNFLAARVRALEECASSPSAKSSSNSSNSSRVHVATAAATASSACPLCKSRHYLNTCPDFIAKSPIQRRDLVKQFKRCFNCLSGSHSARECKSKYSCRTCSKKHHTMLHAESDSGSGPSAAASQSSQSVATAVEINSLFASARASPRSQVLLATAWVKVKVASGRAVTVRALLDQGSEATFISENLCQLLRAKRIRMPISISAVGGIHVGTVRHATSISVSPRAADDPAIATTALILISLTSYAPKRVTDISSFAHLSDLTWADTDPTSSDPINIIIGADIYSDLILSGVRKGKVGQPIAQNSVFGWIISGPIHSAYASFSSPLSDSPSARAAVHLTVHHCTPFPALADEVRRFWEIEEIPQAHALTPQDEQCEAHFCETHSRHSDGRYVVRLPFKQGPPIDIGRSRVTAEKMFNSISRRFQSSLALEQEYSAFMRDYEVLGHMRRASTNQPLLDQCVYIPHHPVFRENSATTHLRVVFNASCVTSNGSSLNDHLLAGPKLQTDLPAILLQWRHFKFVYTADVAKMYRQIWLDHRDLNYQRILWQGDPSEGPVDYQLLTVTYGMKCAPFLALRVIKSLVDDEGHRFPLAAPILRNQIYVDDVLFGGDDVTLVRQSRDHLVSLLRCGKFELRKWASNSPVLLEDIDPSDHGLACNKLIANDDKVNILGIVWNPARDAFQFQVTLNESVPKTKRTILSTIAKLYDPLGWVTPVTVAAKIFMQQLWRLQIPWDEIIPDTLLGKWRSIYSKLAYLNDLRIARWTGVRADVLKMELHGFADASNLAYAASVYLKVISASGEIVVSLLAGKSRVAPIAPLTVPRLELSAALLLVRLMNFVRSSSTLTTVPCICWTDSMIILTWLRSHPSRWKTFVANRVSAIQSRLPDAEWRHVPTSDNPADCASRGLFSDDLINHALWWQGPQWLQFSNEDWPQESASCSLNTPSEEKLVSLHLSEPVARWDFASRYSSWPKLTRITAYLMKFINACRRRSVDSQYLPSHSYALSSTEYRAARTFWIKQIQAELFLARSSDCLAV